MKKKVTYSEFLQSLKGTVYEKNYALVLNAIAHHEHTMGKLYKDSPFASEHLILGNAIHDFLESKKYYEC